MITVKYFASLREQLGREEDTLAPDGVASVLDVWNRVSNHTEPPSNLLVAVNTEYSSLTGSVRDGDEVAFFPPVTGG